MCRLHNVVLDTESPTGGTQILNGNDATDMPSGVGKSVSMCCSSHSVVPVSSSSGSESLLTLVKHVRERDSLEVAWRHLVCRWLHPLSLSVSFVCGGVECPATVVNVKCQTRDAGMRGFRFARVLVSRKCICSVKTLEE